MVNACFSRSHKLGRIGLFAEVDFAEGCELIECTGSIVVYEPGFVVSTFDCVDNRVIDSSQFLA